MLFLVFAHRHVGRQIGEDVRSLEHGIAVEAYRGGFAVLASLVFKLRHTVQPANPRHTVEHPAQLSMGTDLGLIEDDRRFGVDSGRKESSCNFPCLFGELGRILPHGNRVQINNTVDTLVFVLQINEVPHRTQIVTQVKTTGRLDTGENAFCGWTLIGHGAAP